VAPYNPTVPELPDLDIVADAFDAALAGRVLTGITAPDPLVLRATPAQAADLEGQLVERVGRRGKHLVLHLERTAVWAAPMLTGRFALVPPTAPRPRAAVAFTCGPRSRPGRPPEPWIGDAAWLPDPRAAIEVRYVDPTRMGKLYLASGDDPTGVPGVAELGPDVDDPALTLEVWRERIRRHPGEVKALLRNQAFVAGLGNAYSDEVLWAARISPFRRRSTLAADEIAALHAALRVTIDEAIDVLRERVPPTFERQVRDHLRVHLRGGEPCPRCGSTISQVGRRESTSWCRACQR
jgi:formamidopyrimidine-DNA glycosylase